MERKLIKQGGGGYTIYLPKKWVEDNQLEKGNELSVNISGKELIIGTKPNDKKSECQIKLINETESSIRTLITNSYRLGYDKIKVYFNSQNQFNILQNIIKTKFIGFEIIKKEKDSCIVENITEPSYDQFDNLFKKIFMNIEELFEITRKKLSEDYIKLEDYNEVEERILKYDNFCRRVISKQKLIKKNPEMFWSFLTFIIHGNRELFHLNKILDKKIKISKETEELFSGAYKIFKLIEKAYYEKDLDSLAKVHELEKDLIYKKAYKILSTKKGNENLIVYHLAVCIREFYQANSPLSGLII